MRFASLLERTRTHWVAIGIVAWALVAALGLKLLLDYQSRPGAPARAPLALPAGSWSAPGTPTLIVLAHPRCPCTRATLSELARIMTRTEGRLRTSVLFVVPPGIDPGWAQTDLWRGAAAIPGVRLILDRDGLEARRFGAATSGQALLYDATGHLRFAGGITPGRGHAGDNAGADAIVSFVERDAADHHEVPVFGCALASPAAIPAKEASSCPK